MPTLTDYLESTIGGSAAVAVVKSTWVQLTNNSTATTYVSTAATDSAGKFTINNLPAGSYSVATGPSATGPWTATGDTNYLVAPTAADNTSTFPGAVTVPSLTDTGLTAAQIPFADTGGLLATDATLTFNKTTKVAGANAVSVTGLTGAQAGGRFVGFTAYGSPTSGTFSVGDSVISKASGSTFVCTVAGTPGTWVVVGQQFNWLDYGADATGVADSTTAIQAAINAANAAGGIAYGPQGTFLAGALTLFSNTTLAGAGRASTTLKLKNAANAALFNGNSLSNLTIRDMTLDSNGVNQTGDCRSVLLTAPTDSLFMNLRLLNCTLTDLAPLTLNGAGARCTIRNVLVPSGSQIGIQLSNGMTDCVIDASQVLGFTDTNGSLGGIYIVTNCHRTKIINSLVNGGTTNGISINGSTGVQIIDTDCTNNLRAAADVRGILIQAASTNGLVMGGTLSGNGEDGVLIADAASTGWEFQGVHATGNNVSARPGGHGFEVDAPRTTVKGCYASGNRSGIYVGGAGSGIEGNICTANAERGIFVYGVSNVRVAGNECSNNGAFPGIEANGPGGAGSVTRLLISGNECYDDRGAGATQTFGIALSTQITNSDVLNNTVWGNVTGQISNGATSPVRIRGNNGYNPLGSVTTPGFPATTVAVTNTTGVDAVAYITNGAGALTVQVDAVTALMVIPASATGTVRIPAGSTFTPSYAAGVPTWKWYGE